MRVGWPGDVEIPSIRQQPFESERAPDWERYRALLAALEAPRRGRGQDLAFCRFPGLF